MDLCVEGPTAGKEKGKLRLLAWDMLSFRLVLRDPASGPHCLMEGSHKDSHLDPWL
jgi:hypothetical protein